MHGNIGQTVWIKIAGINYGSFRELRLLIFEVPATL